MSWFRSETQGTLKYAKTGSSVHDPFKHKHNVDDEKPQVSEVKTESPPLEYGGPVKEPIHHVILDEDAQMVAALARKIRKWIVRIFFIYPICFMLLAALFNIVFK